MSWKSLLNKDKRIHGKAHVVRASAFPCKFREKFTLFVLKDLHELLCRATRMLGGKGAQLYRFIYIYI